MTALFNAFNARTDKFNLLDNIKKNHGFWQILCFIIVVQIILVYVGSVIFDCYGLHWYQWLIIIGMAIGIIPVDLARKAILAKLKKKQQ